MTVFLYHRHALKIQRTGIVLWIVLGCLLLVAIGGLMLSCKSQNSMHQLRLARRNASCAGRATRCWRTCTTG